MYEAEGRDKDVFVSIQSLPGGGGNSGVKKLIWTNFEALPRTKFFLQF